MESPRFLSRTDLLGLAVLAVLLVVILPLSLDVTPTSPSSPRDRTHRDTYHREDA